MPDLETLRVMTKVARLYHSKGIRQTEIASRLGISQARVSRLLQAAVEEGIVRTVVVIPEGLHAEVEEVVEERYSLTQVHVVDQLGDDAAEITTDLGAAGAALLSTLPLAGRTVGFTSWSRSLRAMVGELEPMRQSEGTRVVEMLGDVGPPRMQHEATRSTQRLADRVGGDALFLRVPGVVMSERMRQAVIAQDTHVREALDALDGLDVALVGIGTCEVDPPLVPGDNFFSLEQLAHAKACGAVGQVNLRFLDADGVPVDTGLDDLVIGVTLPQLAATGRRIAVAGGRDKYEAVRAAVRGGWIDTLVTDLVTAERLRDEP